MPSKVFDGQHVQALFDDRGGDLLLVTFNEMSMLANGKRYWGDAIAHKLSLSCLGLVTKTRNWFPQSEMLLVRDMVTAITSKFTSRVLYGFSQGAYAAIKYSALLEGTSVLAFSPQYTINPKVLPDPRFSRHFDAGLHLGMEISANDSIGNVTIFADPNNRRDWVHCKKITSALPHSRLIPIRHMGHASVRAIASREGLRRLLDFATSDLSHDARLAHTLMLNEKKKSFHYHVRLGIAAANCGHPRWARDLYELSFQAKPSDSKVVLLKGMLDKN